MELHKLMRVSVKLLPWILAVIYLIGTIFASLGIDLIILSYIVFGYLTYNPPKAELFFDTQKEKYGINIYNI